MTNLEVLKKMQGMKFYSETFGDTVEIKDYFVFCSDGRVSGITPEDFYKLVKESKVKI